MNFNAPSFAAVPGATPAPVYRNGHGEMPFPLSLPSASQGGAILPPDTGMPTFSPQARDPVAPFTTRYTESTGDGNEEDEEGLDGDMQVGASPDPDAAVSGAYYDDGGHDTESYASEDEGCEDEGEEEEYGVPLPEDIVSTSPPLLGAGAAAPVVGAQVRPGAAVPKGMPGANSQKGATAGRKSTGGRATKRPQAAAKGKGKKGPKSISATAARNQDTWNLRLEQLREYHSAKGDFAVPRKYEPNPQLGYWVNEQRKQTMFWVRGQPSTLNQERMRALFELGFPLPKLSTNPNPKLNSPVTVPGAGDAWTVRLNELREYRLEHGDYQVPRKYTKNTQLGYWVNEQRKQFAFFLKGQKSTLNQPRMKSLYIVGFPFSNPKRGGVAKSTARPNGSDVFREARPAVAKRRPGHQQAEKEGCQLSATQPSVQMSKSSPLSMTPGAKDADIDNNRNVNERDTGIFEAHSSIRSIGVNHMNVTGDSEMEGGSSHSGVPLTMEAVVPPSARHAGGEKVMAVTIGANAKAVSASTKQDTWALRFEELRKFRVQNGHCLVPQQYDQNRKLGLWVSQQRTQYRYWVNGDVSSLTREKIRALKELGFAWSGRSTSGSVVETTARGGRGRAKRAPERTPGEGAVNKSSRTPTDQSILDEFSLRALNEAPVAAANCAAFVSPLLSTKLASDHQNHAEQAFVTAGVATTRHFGGKCGELLKVAEDMKAELEAVQVRLREAKEENKMLRDQLDGVKGALVDVLSAPR